jgi:adenylate kinase family enzyme
MKLIFIYGRPGTGKMSIANHLSEITGYKSFHLHHTIDYVRSIFDRDVKDSEMLVDKFSLDMIEFAIKSNVDFIYTFVYALKEDDYFIKKILKLRKKYDFELYFIQLSCDIKENILRITGKEREKFTKITTQEVFDELNKKYILNQPIPFVNSLLIDNTCKTVEEVSAEILAYIEVQKSIALTH